MTAKRDHLVRILVEQITEERVDELLRKPAQLQRVIDALQPFEPRTYIEFTYGADYTVGEEYLAALAVEDVEVSDWATLMIGGVDAALRRRFHTIHSMSPEAMLPTGYHLTFSPKKIRFSAVRASAIDFGFPDTDKVPFREMVGAAADFGLSPCTLQEGIEMRLHLFGRETLRVAMRGIPLSPTYTALLRLVSEGGLQLRTYKGGVEQEWEPYYPFLWAKKRWLIAEEREISYEEALAMTA